VKWSARIPSQGALKPGQKTSASLSAEIENGWHVYAISQPPGGPVAMAVTAPAGQPFRLAGAVTGTKPDHKFDPNFLINTSFYQQSLTLTVPLLVERSAHAGEQKAKIDVLFQTCNSSMCLPPTTAHLEATATIGVAIAPKPRKLSSDNGKTSGGISGTSGGDADSSNNQSNPRNSNAVSSRNMGTGRQDSLVEQPLSSFIWLAMGMGALSLLTPCVFPMIPITVSYFSKRSIGSRKSAVISALIYSVGIILTFTALGMLLAVVFGAGGVNQLATNPWVNLLITAIFLGFAFSLFDFYFIQVPAGLMNRIDSIARSKEGSQILGSLLMGFTFTLTSFTCTAPFVGTLLVLASQGNWRSPLIGLLAFSTVFSLPFFVLALAPQLISRLPKSGAWMISVKVVMGFLEIAAAMKFLSNADLVWHWGIFTREVILATWVVIGLLIVLYLLGRFRIPRDTPVMIVTARHASVALAFLVMTVWLGTGLFGSSLGEIEAFLPPPSNIGVSFPVEANKGSSDPAELSWILNNYDAALAEAKQQNKPLFIDFTGYTCTNCRWMEANMFPRPEVKAELHKFGRVRLYTDGSGLVFENQQRMERERFGTVALPLYAIVRSDGTSVATFPGLTRDPAQFVAFLQRARRN
jgi:thiol:disulfide interchange protein